MLNASISSFINLPDWEKVQLKLESDTFLGYPLQTKEQEESRLSNLISIVSHFSSRSFLNYSINIYEIRNLPIWPIAIEFFITPKLLDIVEPSFFLTFSKCICCESYIGYRHRDFRQSKKVRSKVIPFYGRCKIAQPYDNNLKPDMICPQWSPLKIYEQILNSRIKSLLQNKSYVYNYSDYKRDLGNIYIWDYFQNVYDLKK